MGKRNGLKALLKFADSLVSGGEKLYEQFNGKSRSEALEFLKGNFQALNSEEARRNLQNILKSEDPQKLLKFVRASGKFNKEDAVKLVEILTTGNPAEDLPEHLKKKINSAQPMPKAKGKKGPGKNK